MRTSVRGNSASLLPATHSSSKYTSHALTTFPNCPPSGFHNHQISAVLLTSSSSMHSTERGVNIPVRSSFGISLYTTQPKHLRWLMSGTFPKSNWYRVLPSIDLEGLQAWRYEAVLMDSAQKGSSRRESIIIERAFVTKVRIIRSLTPFLCWV